MLFLGGVNRLTRSHKVLLTLFGFVQALIYIPFARLGVDPHHDGVSLIPALVVAKGGIVHRDVFEQYGLINSLLHGLMISVFGNSLWAIRLGTAITLGVVSNLFFWTWMRLYGLKVAVVSVLFLIGTCYFFAASTPMHPWSSDIYLLIQATIIYLCFSKRFMDQDSTLWWSVIGFLCSLMIFTRTPNGLITLIFVSTILLVADWKIALRFLLGAIACGLSIFTYMMSHGALDEWWIQTIEGPIQWSTQIRGFSLSKFLFDWITREVFPCLFILFTIFLICSSQIFPIKKRDLNLLRLFVFGVLCVGFLIKINTNYSLYFNRESVLVTLVALGIATCLSGVYKTFFSSIKKRISQFEIRSLVYYSVALSSFSQIYPVADNRHYWWSVIPSIGISINFLYKYVRREKLLGIIASLSLSFLLLITLTDIVKTLRTPRQSIPGVPLLNHMLMDSDHYKYFSFRFAQINRYASLHPQTPVLNLCADGLYVALSNRLGLPDPYFVYWSTTASYFDENKRVQFITGMRPIVWMCPPAPDAKVLAAGYKLRLLPSDPLLEFDKRSQTYPYSSWVGVPQEWKVIENP